MRPGGAILNKTLCPRTAGHGNARFVHRQNPDYLFFAKMPLHQWSAKIEKTTNTNLLGEGCRFRKWTNDAGLSNLSSHWIRKATGNFLAQEGASQ